MKCNIKCRKTVLSFYFILCGILLCGTCLVFCIICTNTQQSFAYDSNSEEKTELVCPDRYGVKHGTGITLTGGRKAIRSESGDPAKGGDNYATGWESSSLSIIIFSPDWKINGEEKQQATLIINCDKNDNSIDIGTLNVGTIVVVSENSSVDVKTTFNVNNKLNTTVLEIYNTDIVISGDGEYDVWGFVSFNNNITLNAKTVNIELPAPTSETYGETSTLFARNIYIESGNVSIINNNNGGREVGYAITCNGDDFEVSDKANLFLASKNDHAINCINDDVKTKLEALASRFLGSSTFTTDKSAVTSPCTAKKINNAWTYTVDENIPAKTLVCKSIAPESFKINSLESYDGVASFDILPECVAGQIVQFHAVPMDGYQIDKISFLSETETIDATYLGNNTYEFVMPNHDVNLSISTSLVSPSEGEITEAINETPQTGDYNSVQTLAALVLLSIPGFVLALRKRKIN